MNAERRGRGVATSSDSQPGASLRTCIVYVCFDNTPGVKGSLLISTKQDTDITELRVELDVCFLG